ncbi:MAG TPA: LysR family transcriptional regulator [Acidimicrobiales bacterium]|nr:LysR family transcriptional regulator [Acidimicrobiales bacterium]
MTLSQLRAFVEVAATGSVRQAAAHLVVSQPAVSAAVTALSRDLGVPLVARDGRGLELTPAGRVFAGYARQVLGLLDEARGAAAGQLHPERGRVRLAAVTTAGEHVLPPYLAAFRTRCPEAQMTLEVGNRNRVWELLTYREVDLVIGGRPPAGGRFATVATRANRLVVVAPRSDGPEPANSEAERPLPRRVTVAELAERVWLVREPGSGTRGTTEELFENLGISPPTLTLGSNGAIRESVRAGLGVTLISRDAVARELDLGALEEWRGPGLPLERSWHVVGRADEELAPTAALFLERLTSTGQVAGNEPFRRTDR